MKKYNVGLIGCGNISRNYMCHARDVYSEYYRIAAVADIDVSRAKEIAEEFGVETYGTPEVIYNNPDIDIVLNLTVPMAHEEVCIRALESGKHIYTEKPLACTREGMKRILETAKKCGKRVGCAPDTFMSAPVQSAKREYEADLIGEAIGISAMCATRGNETWRPDSDFFYKEGAGPMMDMAPYYLNIFINLIGPVESVMTASKITWPERTIKVAPRRGEKIGVEVPTYVSVLLKFRSGAIATFTNTFDVWGTKQPFIEIYGQKGTMVLPDPNRYQGPVLVKRLDNNDWTEIPQFVECSKYGRGIGIVDMIRSIEAGVPHRASGEMAYHVTDVILAMDESAKLGREVKIESSAEIPEGLWKSSPEEILWK